MNKLLLILSLPLLLVACPKEEISPENNGSLLAEAAIGTAGGSLVTAGISVTVPPGTFPSTYTVQIFEEVVHTDDFGGNTVTPVYRITGIPSVTEGPMTLRIRYEGILEDESFITMGELNMILEPGEEMATYALYPAIDSSGYLVAEIPALIGEPEDGEGLKSTYFPSGLVHLIYGVSRMKTYEGSYFSFSYPSGLDRQKILQLSGYMDGALQACGKMNLINQGAFDATANLFGKPRVVVTNKYKSGADAFLIEMPRMGRLSDDDDGMTTLARFSEYLGIKVNTSRLALEQVSAEELKATSYMWVYRMVYFLYFGDYMDWYAYASAIWMKEKFAGVSDYNPALFPIVGMSPFRGMEAGKELYAWGAATPSTLGGRILHHEKYHAMGMYPFVKYLDQRYPDDEELYIRIMREIIISESGKPMEGIINALEESEYLWWPGFFENYISGQLADIPAEEFLKIVESADVINFSSEEDKVKYNDADYADLSARLHRVSFQFPEFGNETSLGLRTVSPQLNTDYLSAMAFGLNGDDLEYLDYASDLSITDLKVLKENGTSDIVVAVINSASEPTEDERLNIELETLLKTKPKDFISVQISLGCRTNYTMDIGNTFESYFYYTMLSPREGEVFDKVFRASWDEDHESLNYSGTVEVEFDPEQYPFYITRFSVTEDNDLAMNESITITGENIELKEFKLSVLNEHYFKFSVYGNDICNYITGVNKIARDDDFNVLSYGDGYPICDAQSYFDIYLYCAD